MRFELLLDSIVLSVALIHVAYMYCCSPIICPYDFWAGDFGGVLIVIVGVDSLAKNEVDKLSCALMAILLGVSFTTRLS